MAEKVYHTETPTPNLRFVEREGKRILQQRWAITSYLQTTSTTLGQRGEWRDVPLRPEDDPNDRQ